MEESKLENIVHIVIAKPIAWIIYGLWLAVKWSCRGAVRFGRWAWSRWIEYRQKREAKRSSLA